MLGQRLQRGKVHDRGEWGGYQQSCSKTNSVVLPPVVYVARVCVFSLPLLVFPFFATAANILLVQDAESYLALKSIRLLAKTSHSSLGHKIWLALTTALQRDGADIKPGYRRQLQHPTFSSPPSFCCFPLIRAIPLSFSRHVLSSRYLQSGFTDASSRKRDPTNSSSVDPILCVFDS